MQTLMSICDDARRANDEVKKLKVLATLCCYFVARASGDDRIIGKTILETLGYANMLEDWTTARDNSNMVFFKGIVAGVVGILLVIMIIVFFMTITQGGMN